MVFDTKGMYKETIMSPLVTEKAAVKEMAVVLKLPEEKNRQPDLQYLTAIFVSSGMNKNGAVFMGSELIKARDSIVSKAVDFEHDEQSIIGQITDTAFLNRSGISFDAELASTSLSVKEMDRLDMDIAIAAIIHQARFPEIAAEIANGEWMVSMEAFFEDFDIKIGDKIIPREAAEKLGYDKLIGSRVSVKDGNKEVGFHLVGRVLRNILFAGVGIVKKPANDRSIILEAAALNDYVESGHEGSTTVVNLADVAALESGETIMPKEEASVEFDLDKFKDAIKEVVQEVFEQYKSKESADMGLSQIRPGTCTSYKKYVYSVPEISGDDPADNEPNEFKFGRPTTQIPLANNSGGDEFVPPGSTVAREHYCALFDLDCSSRPGDATHPNCWRNVFARSVREEVDSFEEILRRRRIEEGLVDLQLAIDETHIKVR